MQNCIYYWLFLLLELPAQNNSTIHNDLDNAYELDNLNNKQSSTSNNGDKEEKPASEHNANGLSILTAAIFIIGEICGAGAISFPLALSKTGIYGKRNSFILKTL